MSPFKYYLCRSDKQTKQRHLATVHSMEESCHVRIVDINALEAKEALNCYRMACDKKIEKKGNNKDQATTDKSAAASSLLPEDEIETENPFEELHPAKLVSGEEEATEASHTSGDCVLESKVDTVIDMLKNLSTRIQQPKTPAIPDLSVMIKELSTDKCSQLDWSTAENIIDLTEKVQTVRFFAGQFGQKGCVRCQTCFDYLCARNSVLTKHDPLLADDDGHAIATHIKKYVFVL